MPEYSMAKSRSEIPGWVQFRDDGDGFIDRGLARKKLRVAYQKLKGERGVIKKRPTDLLDLKKKLKSSYDKYNSEIIQNATAYIQHNRNSQDIFQHFQKRAERYRLHDIAPFSIFEAAFEQLAADDDPSAITALERKKLLTAIEKKMAAIKEQLAEVSPPGDFDLVQGEVNGDIFVQFYTYWSSLQGSSRGEVGLEGGVLRDAAENEIKIFYRLALDKI
jgi:hypothetical protein